MYYEPINIYILFNRISRVQNIVKSLINYLRILWDKISVKIKFK